MATENQILKMLKERYDFSENTPFTEDFPPEVLHLPFPEDFYQFYRCANGGAGSFTLPLPAGCASPEGTPIPVHLTLYDVRKMPEMDRELRVFAAEIYMECTYPSDNLSVLPKDDQRKLDAFYDRCVILGEYAVGDMLDTDYLIFHDGNFFLMYRYNSDSCMFNGFEEDELEAYHKVVTRSTFGAFLEQLMTNLY